MFRFNLMCELIYQASHQISIQLYIDSPSVAHVGCDISPLKIVKSKILTTIRQASG